jgi:carbon monoxide dehydrogenase subunit G
VQLEQSFDVPFAIDDVWRWFHNIEAVVECLPGASLRAPPDAGKLQLAMAVKLGPITASFVGDGEVAFDATARSGTVSGAAIDRKSNSRIKGQVVFALTEGAAPMTPTTHVALVIDYAMGGTLAQFSREGIVRDLAQRMTDTFAANLRRKLEAAQPAVVEPGQAAADDGDVVPIADRSADIAAKVDIAVAGAQPASLNMGALLWAAFVHRIRRLFRRRPPV